MGKKSRARKAQRRQRRKDKENKEMMKVTYPNNYKTTTTTTWKAPKPPCHTGQNKVFTTTGGIDVYAGGRNRSGGWWVMHPAPDLAIGPDETMRPSYSKSASTIVPEGWSCDQFVGRTDPPKYMIEMDFPDFGIPKVDDYFWYALHDDILEYGIKSISTQCAGGHGRTGVQLAILYYLLNDDDVKSTIADAAQLIELIRDLHCSHAVETNEQQRYIARVLDIPVGKSVIENKYGGWDGYSYGGWGSDKGKANPPQTTGATLPKSTTTTGTTSYDLNEKYTMLPKPVDDEFCDCCGNPSYDMVEDRCFACNWELPTSQVKMMCAICEQSKCDWEFLSPTDIECIMCLAAELGISHNNVEGTVLCGECNVYKFPDMVKEYANGAFCCLACEYKLPATKKEEEQ